MSSSRLLILGVLRIKQPSHGYEIRRELELWGAERWANIAYGSIYHALGQMSKEGLIKPVVHHGPDRVNNRPARTSYALTESGEVEFQRLLRESWWDYKPVIDPFQVALTFMNEMPRDELLASLRHRQMRAQADTEVMEFMKKSYFENKDYFENNEIPNHIVENLRLADYQLQAYVRWTEEAIEKIERGELP